MPRSQRGESGSIPLWGTRDDARQTARTSSFLAVVVTWEHVGFGSRRISVQIRAARLFFGATSQLAMAPVSKTDELNSLRSSTLLRSAF